MALIVYTGIPLYYCCYCVFAIKMTFACSLGLLQKRKHYKVSCKLRWRCERYNAEVPILYVTSSNNCCSEKLEYPTSLDRRNAQSK